MLVSYLLFQSVILTLAGNRSELLFLTHYVLLVNELLISVNRYCSKNISFLLNRKAHIYIERNMLMTTGEILGMGMFLSLFLG